MKKVHLALGVADFDASVREYTARLGTPPCCTVEGSYALWRTDLLNLSIRVDPASAGKVRHLGFEDSDADSFSVATDANGFVWERFAAEHQRAEITQLWPNAKFQP
jgi:hypothetical protein